MAKIRRVLRGATANCPEFELAYVRTGPRTSTPTLVIAGGPGLGSIAPYRGLRRIAARGGLDLIMVEHRGVGFSRNDVRGNPLPQSAMRITDVLDDFATVLDREGVDLAYVSGSSYGSYLASAFGIKYADRVAGMVLDSALQSAEDLALERALIRDLFWHADTALARAVKQLFDRSRRHAAHHRLSERLLLDVVRAAYELCGSGFTTKLLEYKIAHRFSLTWWVLELYAVRDESIVRIARHYEFDIAGAIGFCELNYAAAPDGFPLDPALTYAPLASRFPSFAGEPFDLPSETAKFDWPIVLLVGSRDVRTPPAIAERLAASARQAVLIEIENGHSALDTHPAAMLNAIRELGRGTQQRLPLYAAKLNRLPRKGFAANLPRLLRVMLRVESALWGLTQTR